MRTTVALWVGLSVGSLLGFQEVEADPAVREVRECMEGNVPSQTSVQTVEFVAVDRVGGERISRAKIYAKELDDGYRRMKLRWTKPEYQRNSELLIIETDGSPDTFLYTPELRRPKRITGTSGGGTLFGTDFSYEDFERWQGFNRPGQTKREPDSDVEGRPAYVLVTYPSDDAVSAYERVVTFVDKETCVTLRTDSYEPGETLRKVLAADPESLLQEGSIWIATKLQMKDLVDQTHTNVVVEDLEVDREVKDTLFSVGRMGRRRD
jgi:hypothetical protein